MRILGGWLCGQSLQWGFDEVPENVWRQRIPQPRSLGSGTERDKDQGQAGDTGAWSWETAPEGRGGACSDGETAIGFRTRRALENLVRS